MFPKNKKEQRWIQYGKSVGNELESGNVENIKDVDRQCEAITTTILKHAQSFRKTDSPNVWRHNRAVRRLLQHRALLMKYLEEHVWSSKLEALCINCEGASRLNKV